MKTLLMVTVMCLLFGNAQGAENEPVTSGNTVWRGGNQVHNMGWFCRELSEDQRTDLECSYDSRAPDRLIFIGPSASTMKKNGQFISVVARDFCADSNKARRGREVYFIDQSFQFFARHDCLSSGFRELSQQEISALSGGSSQQTGPNLQELESTCREIDAQDWATCDLVLGRDKYKITVTVPDIKSASIFVERFEENYFRMLCLSANESGRRAGVAIISSKDRGEKFVSTCKNGTSSKFVSQ